MKPIKRITVIEATAEALSGLIRSGRWSGRIPGTRLLAAQLKVSQPTVQKALQLLVERGVVESAGERRSYQTSATLRSSFQPKESPRKHIFLLTHQDLRLVVDSAQKIVESLRKQFASNGWEVSFRSFDYLHAKAAHRSWDRILEVEEGEPVIALYGRPCLAEWALKRGIRMAFLGGVTDGLPIPMFAVKSSQMLGEAYRRLIALGHTRIVTPLCDRAESFSKTIKDEARLQFERAGLAYSAAYTNPERDYLTPDVTRHLMESLFKQAPPTAIVLLDWRELVAVFCFLSSRGLRVPQDVSLVLLNEQTDSDWFSPPLARFRFHPKRMVSQLHRWAEGKSLSDMKGVIEATWVPGESIGPPP